MYTQATHTCRGRELKTETACILDVSMYCCVGSHVILTNNIFQPDGLLNGDTGTVMDIFYVTGTSAPGLPKFIIVDFCTDYRGPKFFPGYPNISGWAPMHPITAHWYTKITKVSGNYE